MIIGVYHIMLMQAANSLNPVNDSGLLLLRGVVMLIFGVLAAWCLLSLRKPGTNWKCVFSLGLLLSSSAVAFLSALLGRVLHPNILINGLIGLIILGGFVASPVIAYWGLVEYYLRKPKYSRGRTHALGTFGLVLIMFAFGVFIQYQREKKSGNPGYLSNSTQTGGQLWQTFDEFNFRILTPNKPWVQLDAKKLNKNGTVAFSQANPQICFMVNGSLDPTGNVSTDTVVEVAKANMRSATDYLNVISEKPLMRQGLEGVELELEVKTGVPPK